MGRRARRSALSHALELGPAAAAVIGARAAMMANPGGTPDFNLEMTRMVSEKMEAGMEIAAAKGMEVTMNAARTQMEIGAELALDLSQARSIWDVGAAQMRWFTRTMDNADTAEHVLSDMVMPLHRRVMANRRRLKV